MLDAGGHVVALQRQDKASNKRAEIAYGKAHGCSVVGRRVAGAHGSGGAAALLHRHGAAAIGGALISVPDGVLVRDPVGNLVGALGVSGYASDNDELVAVASIEAAVLTAQPA
jgi:uncharacterized protein GlcG (DUF336 family)